jgi:hypothetical protein
VLGSTVNSDLHMSYSPFCLHQCAGCPITLCAHVACTPLLRRQQQLLSPPYLRYSSPQWQPRQQHHRCPLSPHSAPSCPREPTDNRHLFSNSSSSSTAAAPSLHSAAAAAAAAAVVAAVRQHAYGRRPLHPARVAKQPPSTMRVSPSDHPLLVTLRRYSVVHASCNLPRPPAPYTDQDIISSLLK